MKFVCLLYPVEHEEFFFKVMRKLYKVNIFQYKSVKIQMQILLAKIDLYVK